MYLETPILSSSKEPKGHQESSPQLGNGETAISKQGEAKNEQTADSTSPKKPLNGKT